MNPQLFFTQSEETFYIFVRPVDQAHHKTSILKGELV